MIVLTGAAGYVGEAVHARLLRAGHRVLALTHDDSFVLTGDTVSLDLNNAEHLERLAGVCRGAQALIHLAGVAPIELAAAIDGKEVPRASARSFVRVYQSNVVMTACILEVALACDVEHLVFASSQTVYGLPQAVVVTEESPLVPLEHYAASKMTCETAITLWARGHGRKATILRFPGVWSEERRSGLIHELGCAAVRDGLLRIGADYPLPLDVIHRDDVVAAFCAAVNRQGNDCRVYNVSTGEPCSLFRLAQDISSLLPACRIETFGMPQPDILLDASRADRELGWRASSRRDRLAKYVRDLQSRYSSHA